MFLRFLISIFMTTLLLPSISVFGGDKYDIPPLYYSDTEKDYEYQKELLGPFITINKDERRSEYGLRPLFYRLQDERNQHSELDVIYPLFTYWHKDNMTSMQFLLYLMKYDTEELENGFTEREFTFFPFIFYRDAFEDDKDHFGIFPIYGELKDSFSKDEIKFLMFPLFLKTKDDGDKTTSILWPFFSTYSGDHEGFRIWPLYGKRTKEKNDLNEKFIMWPFYVRNEKQFYGKRVYTRSFFPFYSESEMFGIRHRSYFWPLVSKTVSDAEGFERWDVPWPLVNITRGKKYQTRFFPFFSRSESGEKDEDGFILWPLYRYSTIHLEDYSRDKKTLLLFLYKQEVYEPKTQEGKSGKRIDLWPLFTYSNIGDSSHFHILTILEPFIRSNERLYRNYAPFWRIFEWRKEGGSSKASLLWDIVSFTRSGEVSVFKIKPLVPVVSLKNGENEHSFKLLGGLLGFTSKESREILHLLYYPFRFGNEESNESLKGGVE